MSAFVAVEWIGDKEGERDVFVKFETRSGQSRIMLTTKRGVSIRSFDVKSLANQRSQSQENGLTNGNAHSNKKLKIQINTNKRRPIFAMKVPKEYDLVSD